MTLLMKEDVGPSSSTDSIRSRPSRHKCPTEQLRHLCPGGGHPTPFSTAPVPARQTLAGWRGAVQRSPQKARPLQLTPHHCGVTREGEAPPGSAQDDAGLLLPNDASRGHYGARSSPQHGPRRGPPNPGSPKPTTSGAHSRCPVVAGSLAPNGHPNFCPQGPTAGGLRKQKLGPRAAYALGVHHPPPSLPKMSSGCPGVLATLQSRGSPLCLHASLGQRAGPRPSRGSAQCQQQPDGSVDR